MRKTNKETRLTSTITFMLLILMMLFGTNEVGAPDEFPKDGSVQYATR